MYKYKYCHSSNFEASFKQGLEATEATCNIWEVEGNEKLECTAEIYFKHFQDDNLCKIVKNAKVKW